MELKYILYNTLDYKIFGNIEKNIEKLCQNSKKCTKNCLFFCIDGTKTTGALYIKEAIINGAVAVVLEEKQSFDIENLIKKDDKTTFVFVKDLRKSMAIMCASFFDNPQKKLKIVGITGTNGKSSTAFICYNLLKIQSKKVGLIGTSGIFFDNKKIDLNMTTPDSIDLFEIFAKMVKAKIEYCIMEVSAHAIYFDKVYGIDFAIKALTNVKSDHLDFFKTKQNYKNTKKKFFENGEKLVINVSDRIGQEIVFDLKKDCIVYFYNKIKNEKICKNFSKNNVFYAKNTKFSLKNTSFDLIFRNRIYKINSNLIGKFNIENILCAVAILFCLGFEPESFIQNISQIRNVAGRFDCVFDKDIFVIIDYAHTTDSLKNFLKTVKSVSKNKNIIVFGCPGERDSYKRFEMGKLAGRFCEYVILTTDNPASENARRIMFEMLQGVKQTNAKCFCVEDRKSAIKKAIKIAKKEKDANVLIVGKGVEEYQIVGDKHVPYSDYAAVNKLLA